MREKESPTPTPSSLLLLWNVENRSLTLHAHTGQSQTRTRPRKHAAHDTPLPQSQRIIEHANHTGSNRSKRTEQAPKSPRQYTRTVRYGRAPAVKGGNPLRKGFLPKSVGIFSCCKCAPFSLFLSRFLPWFRSVPFDARRSVGQHPWNEGSGGLFVARVFVTQNAQINTNSQRRGA